MRARAAGDRHRTVVQRLSKYYHITAALCQLIVQYFLYRRWTGMKDELNLRAAANRPRAEAVRRGAWTIPLALVPEMHMMIII